MNMRQSYLNYETTLKRMLYFTMIDVEFLNSLSVELYAKYAARLMKCISIAKFYGKHENAPE